MTAPITPLTCYSLRGFDPSERFAFVVAVRLTTAYGYVWFEDQGRMSATTWCVSDGEADEFTAGFDLLSPLPNHPLPECLAHLRPEPVAWRWPAPECGPGMHWLSEQRQCVPHGSIAEPLAPIKGQ